MPCRLMPMATSVWLPTVLAPISLMFVAMPCCNISGPTSQAETICLPMRSIAFIEIEKAIIGWDSSAMACSTTIMSRHCSIVMSV